MFGSLSDYEKGGVEVIDDDPRYYVFSNVFEVASMSKPYEKVCVGKNLRYVIEAVRAEGNSHWYARSEEHTSELQSRVDLVCRLLLEKKKKNTNHTQTHKQTSTL